MEDVALLPLQPAPVADRRTGQHRERFGGAPHLLCRRTHGWQLLAPHRPTSRRAHERPECRGLNAHAEHSETEAPANALATLAAGPIAFHRASPFLRQAARSWI